MKSGADGRFVVVTGAAGAEDVVDRGSAVVADDDVAAEPLSRLVDGSDSATNPEPQAVNDKNSATTMNQRFPIADQAKATKVNDG